MSFFGTPPGRFKPLSGINLCPAQPEGCIDHYWSVVSNPFRELTSVRLVSCPYGQVDIHSGFKPLSGINLCPALWSCFKNRIHKAVSNPFRELTSVRLHALWTATCGVILCFKPLSGINLCPASSPRCGCNTDRGFQTPFGN